jgi:anhydro-N-acetylmuramic acid kinase
MEHTALHQPEEHLTYQIGNQQRFLRILSRKKVVCDFTNSRCFYIADKGAPLVPIGDALLFPSTNLLSKFRWFCSLF